jgi:MFS family permease
MTTTSAGAIGRDVRLGFALVGLPVAIGLGVLATGLALRDQLPDPVAIHWGTDGVDGFAPFTTDLWLSVGMTIGFGVLIGLVMGLGARRVPSFRRGAGAMAGGLAGFIGGTSIGTWWVQRGLSDARDAPDVGAVLLVALVVGVITGGLGAWLAPGQMPGDAAATEAVPAEAPRLELAPGQRAAWVGWAVSPTMVVVSVLSIVPPLVVLAVLGLAQSAIVIVLVITGSAVLTMSAYRVTAGLHGLRVRSIVGFPRFTVPLSEVAEASVVDVRPMQDFGGWGLRGNFRGQFGVIQRAGEALQVRRGDGSSFVVTIDRAAEPAALLNTLADRSR